MKKTKIAIVGPADSVALINKVAQERSEYLEIQPIVYKDAREVPNILDTSLQPDVWLFSGIAPYNHAVAATKTSKPLMYIPHQGTSLYRVLLQITYMAGLSIQSISFDTFSFQDIEETFVDAGLPLPSIYTNHFNGLVSAQEMTDYHYELWKSGKTQIAVTCFLATYENLKQLGVPAFRIWPTRNIIRSTLDMVESMAETARFKGGQIAIQHVGLDHYNEIVRANNTYGVTRIELQLYELLVDYTEKVEGSLVVRGNGQYTVYSTRGLVEELTDGFTVMPLLDEITRRIKATVSGGIGFGQTAYDADQNAHIALGAARRLGPGNWMVVTDDKVVVGPLSSAIHLRYSIRTEDSVIRELAEQLNISITTLNKLYAAIDKLDNNAINAEDLALYLAITQRSARRLIGNMVENGLAEVAGEELLSKGRPRKLYRIIIDKLLGR